MNLSDEIKEAGNFFGRQAAGFVDILKLKLKIIGFANKRGNIFTRLGELSYKAQTEGRSLESDETIQKIIEDVKEAERVIAQTDEVIFNKRQTLAEDRKIFKERLKGKEAVADEKPHAGNPDNPAETGHSEVKQGDGGENKPS